MKPVVKKLKVGLKTYKIEYGNYDSVKSMAECEDQLNGLMESIQSSGANIKVIDDIVSLGTVFFDSLLGVGSGKRIFKASKKNVFVFLDHVINTINEYNALKSTVKMTKIIK